MNKSRTPFLLSLIAAAAGVVGLVSALTPEWPLRLRIVQDVLSPTGPSVADGLVVASSIALLFLAGGLARRRHRAWQAAMLLLGAGAVLHVLKGLDVEEAVFDVFVMSLLWSQRGWFDAKGDPGGPLRAAAAAFGSLAGLYVYGVGAIALHLELRGEPLAPTSVLRQVSYGLVGLDVSAHPGRFDHELTLSLACAAVVLAAYVLWVALRPRDKAPQQSDGDRADARRLVARAGGDSLAYFALRRDKSYFFNAERTAFLAYRAVGGVALVSGDPIGDHDAIPALVEDFASYCHEHAWRVAVIGVGSDHRDAWASAGLRTLYVGDEAIVRPAAFSLEGRPIRKVRQSVTRLRKAGYEARVARVRDLSDAEWREIDRVSHAWLHGQPERGFSMAMDDMQDPDHGDTVVTLATDAEGRIAGFLHFVPVGGAGGSAESLSLSAMRRLLDTPNGLTEFLLCETFAWGKEAGIDRVSLNFNAFGELMRSDAELPRIQRLVRFALGKVGSSRVDLQACKLEYSIVSPK